MRAAVDGRLGELDELSEPGVWAVLGEALRDGDSVFAASSMPVRDLEAFLRPGPEGVRIAANRGANGIDGLVSTAAGSRPAAEREPGPCSATSRSSTTSAASPPPGTRRTCA